MGSERCVRGGAVRPPIGCWGDFVSRPATGAVGLGQRAIAAMWGCYLDLLSQLSIQVGVGAEQLL